jgi:hypothetical protein
MFCPKCGQQQLSEETKFCSRCGFLLTAVWDLVSNNGLSNQTSVARTDNAISPRKKGIKRGGKLLMLGLIIVPLLVIFSALFQLHPALVIAVSILTFWGGILRMIYARLFESAYPNEIDVERETLSFAKKILGKKTNALPPQSISVSSYAPPAASNWRDTNDLPQPSVIENTTKLLEKDR